MKKFYVLIVACFVCTVWTNAQTYYWVGPSSGSGGLWSDANNWSSTSGGSGGAGIPNGASENVVIDQDALVNVDIVGMNLSTFRVTNNADARLFINSGATSYTLTLLSTSSVTPALQIDAGSTLTDSADIDLFLTIAFYNNAKGLVNGSWIFTGSSAVTSKGAGYSMPGTGYTNQLNVNGTLEFRNYSAPTPISSSEGYVFFNSGSSIIINKNGGAAPYGRYDAASTIYMTGATTTIPTIQDMAVKEIGNLVFNCPSLNTGPPYVSMALPSNLIIKGNLQIQNTNNQTLVLATNGSIPISPFEFTYTVMGNFDISGTSRVSIGRASSGNRTGYFQINGNLNAGGTSFDIQTGTVTTNYTYLQVKGNINHTAGTFNTNNTATASTSVDLYVIEMNGSAPQTISSWNGSLDNSSNEVTLLLNNAAGVTLSTAVAVGKISWNSAGKGLLNTTASHVLTINNTGTHSLVVNSPGSTGYVSGPVRRKTAGVGPYVMPTGKGGTYHSCSFVPNGSGASVYQAEYFNTAYPDLSVLSPLNGVSNLEYWTANTISGIQSSLALSLTGTAVPGATALDDVAVGRYNGADWVYYSGNLGGSVITPGNLTTGTTGSGPVTINGTFTFAFGPTGALPIDLLSLDARKLSSSSAQLTWTISDNSTPQKFVVLSSQDGGQFSEIGTVTAVGGQTRYNFTDNHLGAGTTYYRLRLVDIDGSFKLSRIVAVVNRSTAGALITALSPTVVHTTAQLSVSSNKTGAMLVAVTDGYGRVVKQMRIAVAEGSQQVQLNFTGMPAGVYQLTGYLDGERAGTVRFIKK